MIISHVFLNLQEEDNLSTVDKMAGPNASFIRRFRNSQNLVSQCQYH